MLAIKKYFTSRKRRNSAEYGSAGVICTCPYGGGDGRPASEKDNLSLPSPSLFRNSRESESWQKDRPNGHEVPRYTRHRYRRSISLGQILQSLDGSCSDGVTASTSLYYYPHSASATSTTTDTSFTDTYTDGYGRELSDFEKENLLFLKELDNSYHRTLSHSLSNTSLGSTFSEDSLAGDSTPRGGSPYPGRREYPPTAYFPSKTSPSNIIRSISREENEDEVERDVDGKNKSSFKRKISLPIFMGHGSTSDSSTPSSVCSLPGSSAWWTNKQAHPPPLKKFSGSHMPSFTSARQSKMHLINRSLSSPVVQSSMRNTTASERPCLKSWNALASGVDALPNSSQNTDCKIRISDEPGKALVTSTPPTNTSSIILERGHHNLTSGEAKDGVEKQNVNVAVETKKPSPMAFTVELGGESGGGDVVINKKLDITASISKWAPKHRRNLSLTKVDEHKVVENFFDENGNSRAKRRSTISRLDKVEEHSGKPPVGRPRSGTIGATGLQQGRRGGGYHSEGYFSSDQDDECPRKTELKSPRSPRTPELRSPQTPQRLIRSSSQDSAKGASLRMRTPSPDNVSRTSHTMTLNESASYLIEKLMMNTPETQRKQPCKTEGRACCKADKKPTTAEVTARIKSDKGSKIDTKMTAESRKESNSATSLGSSHTYQVKQDKEHEGGKEEKDDVSEAGTYTIEKDSSSPEVEQARNNIDRVFGVSGTESEVDVITPQGNAPTHDLWTPTPEPDKFKSPSSLSRNSPNWIRQWAAQVAEHTKPSDASINSALGSPRGPKPPLASLSSSQESSDSRPRRKLPTPPTHHSTFAMASMKTNDLSDQESPIKGRQLFGPLILGDHQSGFSCDTESFLRDTEQLVTSLQARVDMNKGIPPGLRGSSFESHDSGGDSDLDTSTSYPINDDDDRLVKRLGSQLKTKLKLGGIDGSPKSPPITTSPRKPDPLALETRLKLTNHFKRERSIVSDSGYDVYTAGKEENSLQSDSSSETSEPVKDSRKSIDNNPPLKFNRAFSLRRARLTCDETAQQLKSPLPVDKKKIARPSSAGNITGNRKIPVSQSKSHQVGQTPRGGSHSQATTPKSGSSDFSRGDGGRFSLRLPHSGSSTTVTKSPSRTCVKKELSSGTARRGAPRSNSTLSAKEVDFQNWKRRKNYDPMKAAAEGRKKAGDKKNDRESQGSTLTTLDRSPSPPGSLLRSASFHGTEGMGVCGRWPRRPNHLYTSEDDGPYSLEEEQSHPVPHCSPLQRSPTSPHHLSSPHTTSPAHHTALTSTRGRRASYALSDEGEGHMGSPTRKASLDESGSEGKRSPLGSTRGIVSGRSKAKMEALDNLVISTIHSLSVKVRTTSETLLQKLKSQYDEEGDRAALLEEVLAHLSESDQTLATGQSRSTSRELAGILRNLKKIEHALEVIDRVMVYVEEGDLEDDDLDATTRHEWGESDY
ncbi:nucleolar protein dao-5 isoform X8 [Cherax quadricarinatus]|uniref:nucleolar protein dao-5 isoform X8 n=1 Tax=Cherax quadricarinatus TaxID=27406 RepID=UPI00387EB20B